MKKAFLKNIIKKVLAFQSDIIEALIDEAIGTESASDSDKRDEAEVHSRKAAVKEVADAITKAAAQNDEAIGTESASDSDKRDEAEVHSRKAAAKAVADAITKAAAQNEEAKPADKTDADKIPAPTLDADKISGVMYYACPEKAGPAKEKDEKSTIKISAARRKKSGMKTPDFTKETDLLSEIPAAIFKKKIPVSMSVVFEDRNATPENKNITAIVPVKNWGEVISKLVTTAGKCASVKKETTKLMMLLNNSNFGRIGAVIGAPKTYKIDGYTYAIKTEIGEIRAPGFSNINDRIYAFESSCPVPKRVTQVRCVASALSSIGVEMAIGVTFKKEE